MLLPYVDNENIHKKYLLRTTEQIIHKAPELCLAKSEAAETTDRPNSTTYLL